MATYGTSNAYINYSVNSQELSYDINSNTSVVRVWIDVWRTNSGYTTYGTGTVYTRINGGVYSAGISPSQVITSTPIRLGTWEVRIGHNADGTKAIGVSGWISHERFSSTEQGYTHTLTTIPRQANIINSSDFTDQDNPSITFSNPGGFQMSVWLEPNPNGVHLAVRGDIPNTGSYTWKLTDDELNQLRNACNGRSCTVRIGLYSNHCAWASFHDKTFTLVDAFPSFESVTASPVNSFGSLYLQGKSSIKLAINGAKGIYGSKISSYSINGGDYSYGGTSNTYTTDVLSKSGKITFTATVIDSRGFTASKTVTVSVTAYTSPTLTFDTYRCIDTGEKNVIEGTYICVKPVCTYCKITGNTIKAKSIKIDEISKSTAFDSGNAYQFGEYALNTTHVVEVSVTDTVGSTVRISHVVDIGKVIFNVPPHKNGAAFGRYCDKEGQLQIGYDTNIFGDLMIDGVNILDILYPVGSIYLSVSAVNPGTLFGGTWVRWGEGRVPVGVDTSQSEFDSAEKTGGNKTLEFRALIGATDNDVGRIGYQVADPLKSTYIPGIWAGGNASYSGGITTVNHNTPVWDAKQKDNVTNTMNPYITCYMWCRTA